MGRGARRAVATVAAVERSRAMMYRGERARACVCVHKRNVTCDRIGYLPGLTERPGREEKQARESARHSLVAGWSGRQAYTGEGHCSPCIEL